MSGNANLPVTEVSWFDAARFSNWMWNGQTTGSQGNATTENGAYMLNGATSGVGFTKNGINPNTSAATSFWIPSESEWCKAAYYDPSLNSGSGGYWANATKSSSLAGNTIGVASSATFFDGNYAKDQNSLPSYPTDGGAYGLNSASYYGTFDQAGNLWEWNDAVISGSSRGIRGGSFGDNGGANLKSSFRLPANPSTNGYDIGFRVASVASVPEPSTIGLLALVGAGVLVWKRRKFTLLLSR